MKINIACVSKEYEIKTKMEQEQWLLLKIVYLLGYNLKIVFLLGCNCCLVVEGIKIWWREDVERL